jgi:hypothetical protein
VTWAFGYLYDRRDLIFGATGAPVRAIASDSSVVQLSALSRPSAQPDATLSINTTLNDSARRLGIRNGDPVSVLLTGHNFVQARSGLVVPARIGEQTRVTVPKGSYSITAFGAKPESLFTIPDPYRVVAGNTTQLNSNRQLALSLTPREPLLRAYTPPAAASDRWSQAAAFLAATSAGARENMAPTTLGRCVLCGEPTGTNLLWHHLYVCPFRPTP